MLPEVSLKLQEIVIIKKEWIGHDRDLNANDFASVVLGFIIAFTEDFQRVNLDGALFTIGLLMKCPTTSYRECLALMTFLIIPYKTFSLEKLNEI